MIDYNDLYTYKITQIIKVYDDDTITVKIDLGMHISREITIRLYGINAPELNLANKSKGLESRDWLRGKLNTSLPIYIKTYKDKTEKYGRLLGEIFIEDNEKSLNEQMIELGLAIVYLP
jgi:micrococcal nuclease